MSTQAEIPFMIKTSSRRRIINMAEVLGAVASVLTLASVFKVCIEAFDLIRASRNHEAEVKKLMLKLKIEKCRLLVWGQSMGFAPTTGGDIPKNSSIDLEECPFLDLVRETLESILDLMSNSRGLTGKYGCRKLDASEDYLIGETAGPATPSDLLNSAFTRMHLRGSNVKSQLSKRARWAICDRKKFEVLIRDTKDFIEGLQDITREIATQRKQERDFSLHISTIKDPETLNMISEVCENSHPAFSDAASFRVDSMTLAEEEKVDVGRWLEDADLSVSNSTDDIGSIEDWDLEELRRKYMALLKVDETKAQVAVADTARPRRISSTHHQSQSWRSKHDDLQFAADISTSLLAQVRQLQSVVAEKDEIIKKQEQSVTADVENSKKVAREKDDSFHSGRSRHATEEPAVHKETPYEIFLDNYKGGVFASGGRSVIRSPRHLRFVEVERQPSNSYASRLYKTNTLTEDLRDEQKLLASSGMSTMVQA